MTTTSTGAGIAVSVLGAGLVCWWLVQTAPHSAWAWACAGAAVIGWIARALLLRVGFSRLALTAAGVMIVAGSLAAADVQGASLVPAAIALIGLSAAPEMPVIGGVALGIGAAVLVALGSLAAPLPPAALVIMVSWLGIAVAVGVGRRQTRAAQQADFAAREQELTVREQAARMTIARDLHDVLAHTLGGLAIQLDAVDALLEAGQLDAAHERAVAARALAGAGLAEARRAVAALRDPDLPSDEVVTGRGVTDAVGELAAAHRALGGEVELTIDGAPIPVPSAVAAALERAAQEALSNARRHAPGIPVALSLVYEDDAVRLRVSNALLPPASAHRSTEGSGYGIQGMTERFAALGGSARAARSDGAFVVEVEAPVTPRGAGKDR